MHEAIEVQEHLLQTVEISGREKQDANAFFAYLRSLFERLCDGSRAMLSIINNKLHLFQVHFQNTHLLVLLAWDEGNWTGVRKRNGGKEVAIFIVQNILGDLRYACNVEHALSACRRVNLSPVIELEETGNFRKSHQCGIILIFPDDPSHGWKLYFHSEPHFFCKWNALHNKSTGTPFPEYRTSFFYCQDISSPIL